MLLGAFFLFIAMPGSAIWAIFGQNHTARVTKIWTDTNRKDRTRYHASFDYSLPAGVRSQQKEISAEHYKRLSSLLPPGRTVLVRAIKIGPIFYGNLIDGTLDPWKIVAVLWLLGSFWCLITGAFFNMLYIHPRQERQLCRTGIPIIGKILSKHISHGKSTAYYLRYAFIMPDRQYILSDQSVSYKEWQAVESGQKAIALYNPVKPNRNVLYDYAAYRCSSQ
jgi:hypothetical protein